MATRKSAALLTVRFCHALFALRLFGDTNSGYLTRLENEVKKKGWRLKRARAEKILAELHTRQAELDALMATLRAVLVDYGELNDEEEHALGWFWDESTKIRDLYGERANDLRSYLT